MPVGPNPPLRQATTRRPIWSASKPERLDQRAQPAAVSGAQAPAALPDARTLADHAGTRSGSRATRLGPRASCRTSRTLRHVFGGRLIAPSRGRSHQPRSTCGTSARPDPSSGAWLRFADPQL